MLILLSVVFYTGLTIAAPWYSAGIVNLLWDNIQAADALGEAFRVTWQQGGTPNIHSVPDLSWLVDFLFPAVLCHAWFCGAP